MSRANRLFAGLMVITTVAALVTLLLGVWTGDVRWYYTGAVCSGALIFLPLVAAAIALGSDW